MQQYSLVILKNYDLLHSIKDYFYQSLLQYGFESTITCEQNEIDSILDKITTSHAVVIQILGIHPTADRECACK